MCIYALSDLLESACTLRLGPRSPPSDRVFLCLYPPYCGRAPQDLGRFAALSAFAWRAEVRCSVRQDRKLAVRLPAGGPRSVSCASSSPGSRRAPYHHISFPQSSPSEHGKDQDQSAHRRHPPNCKFRIRSIAGRRLRRRITAAPWRGATATSAVKARPAPAPLPTRVDRGGASRAACVSARRCDDRGIQAKPRKAATSAQERHQTPAGLRHPREQCVRRCPRSSFDDPVV